MSVLTPVLKNLAPRQRVRSLDWFRENIQTNEGRPYDHGAYPHLGAPGGPCDAFDDATVRTIWLQFASRLGKTFFGTSCLLLMAAESPCPMMFASSDQKTATDVISRVYKTITYCKPLACQLRPEKLRNKNRIDLADCRIWTAWSRSVSTLADKPVKVGHANELDKWEHASTSKEADPLKLFTDRGKEYPSRKFIFESTPTVKGASRVEHGRLHSTNCSYWVPCPHCQRYQPLLWDRVRWDKLENGRSDKELARTTAHYECLHCNGKLLDQHRGRMLRAGVWVPEGCGVDDQRARQAALQPWRGWRNATWITGHPHRGDIDAGYQLSSLYATSLGWGDIAAEFVASKDKVQNLRNFINQWLGETWEPIERKQSWVELGKRFASKVPRQKIPDGYQFVTAAVDKQEWGYVYVIDAWGPEQACHTIDYGSCDTPQELQEILLRRYTREGDSDPAETHGLRVAFIDSGFRPKGVVEFCKHMRLLGLKVYPVKGSSKPLDRILRESSEKRISKLIMIDTITSQDWIESHLAATGPKLRTLFNGSLSEHQDFLEQLLNDAPVTVLDKTNNTRVVWNRINDGVPNDYRDCARYNIAAMMFVSRGGAIRGPVKRVSLAEYKARANGQRVD